MQELSYSKFHAALCLSAGCTLISLSPFFVEFSGLDATANSFYRMAIGGIVLFAIALLRGEKLLKANLLLPCFIAASVIALDMVAWNKSVLYIGSGLATVLANLEIVFLVLIGVFFL